LEIVADVVDVGFAAFDFAGEDEVRLADGGLDGFGFTVILEWRCGEPDCENDCDD
jgi:hypothetical protein